MRLGGLFMRVKTVLWSLLLSYGLTGLFLLLLAFLLFQENKLIYNLARG